jgi:sugar lactone lactonase YvrE
MLDKRIVVYLLIDGIAWDWINEKLYWTDTCNDVIEVYDPATGYRRVLLYTGTTSNNRDIVVDPTTGYNKYNIKSRSYFHII